MKLLVTGSGGFIGGSLGRIAARLGHQVMGVSLSSQPDSDWPGEYHRLDLSFGDLAPIIQKYAPDALLHAAGPASVGASFLAPVEDLRGSLITWANTLNGVRRSGLRPLIVFPSSAAIYGNPARLPVAENATPAPISPYGFHKIACELIAHEYAACYGLNVLVCRLFSVFGAAQRRLLIWDMYKQLLGPGATVWLEGTGTESRDYLGIDDIGSLLFRLIDRWAFPETGGECRVINLASGIEVNVLDLARQVGRLIAPGKAVCCRGIQRTGDPRRWQADISLLSRVLPDLRFTPLAVSLAQCLSTWQKDGLAP